MICSMILGNDLFLLGIIDFGIQWVAWIIAAALKSEKFYDLTGSATFILLVSLSYGCQQRMATFHQAVQTGMVIVWATRLGIFLFTRVLKSGEDRRFRTAKSNPALFFVYWTMQGVWVFATLLPTLLLNQSTAVSSLNWLAYTGWTFWTLGFLIEVISDYQKTVFKKDPQNEKKFIRSGLWSISRHPNYFGEMMLWWGLFLSAATSLNGLQWLCIVCPVIDCLLITFVSGIPILEKQALKRYGEDPQYQEYINTTPVLVPFLQLSTCPCSSRKAHEPITGKNHN